MSMRRAGRGRLTRALSWALIASPAVGGPSEEIPGPGAPLHWWTARELAGAMRRRDLSVREVVGWHLDRIAEVNPRLNAIVSLRPEAALAEAEAADRRAAVGEPLGPLHGLPIA